MAIWSVRTARVFACISLLAIGMGVQGAEVKVLSASPMRPVMEELVPQFERASGHRLTINYANLGTILQRIRAGESADIVILPRQGMEALVADGKATAQAVSNVARAGFGVAVRKGAPQPDISSADAFRRALLAARSIAYGNPASGSASGAYFVKVLDRLGIADDMRAKTVLPKSGPAEALLVSGEAELAVNHLVQLVSYPGIDVVGPLPGDLQGYDIYAAAVLDTATSADAAKLFIEFLRAPEAAALIRLRGMEPVRP